MGTALQLTGLALSVVGFVLEVLGVTAMSFYAIRRALPWNPITLAGFGGTVFFVGIITALLGDWIAAGGW